MKTNKLLLFALIVATSVTSCQKDDTPTDIPRVTTGLYVLNEGLYNSNNTTLTYYALSNNNATTDFYAAANGGTGLGDTGNDMILYGGKLYIVMNVSSYLEVANAATAKSIKKIDFKTGSGAARQPRYVVAYKDKVFVSSYDGTVAVIDTATLSIDKFITVGPNPEQMAVSGDKLYVANSGGLNPVMDSTVSVINLTSLTEVQKIKVGVNPGSVAADNAGNIYVGCTGDYGAAGPKLVKINTATNAVVKSADTAVGKIRFYNGMLYTTGGYLGVRYIRTLNTTDFAQTSPNFITDGTTIQLAYGLNIDETTGDVFVGDAKNYTTAGVVYCFDKNGKKKYSFSVSPGLNPNTILTIKQ